MNKNILKITTILCSLGLLPGIASGTVACTTDKEGNKVCRTIDNTVTPKKAEGNLRGKENKDKPTGTAVKEPDGNTRFLKADPATGITPLTEPNMDSPTYNLGGDGRTNTPTRYLDTTAGGDETTDTPKYTETTNLRGSGGTQMLDALGEYRNIPGKAGDVALVDTPSTAVTRPGENGAGTLPKTKPSSNR
jgi:hypothetical protein